MPRHGLRLAPDRCSVCDTGTLSREDDRPAQRLTARREPVVRHIASRACMPLFALCSSGCIANDDIFPDNNHHSVSTEWPVFAGGKISQPRAVAKVCCGTLFETLSAARPGTSPTNVLVASVASRKQGSSGYAFSDFATKTGQTPEKGDFARRVPRESEKEQR